MAVSRQHPVFSRIGCLGGLVLILGIVVAVIYSGGAIFSPGALTAWAAKGTPLKGFKAHADFENDCGQCHLPLQGLAPERCENCHADVGAQRAAQTGLHGRLRPGEAGRCEICHRDHEGRGFDPNTLALKKFDHAVVGFSLVLHITDYSRAPTACTACHPAEGYALDPAACVTCHSDHDPTFMLAHLRAFGLECRACHDGLDRMSNFDHAQTAFPLEGQHAPLECAACHEAGGAPQDTPTGCAACHAEPSVHAGVLGADCAACHTSITWSPARLDDRPAFRHAEATFQLIYHEQDYDGAPFTCRTCHTGEAFTFAVQTCTDCHSAHDAAFMVQHVQAYGPNCLSCHDGAGNMRDFDHNRFFVLDGQHAPLECTACHVNQEYKGTPRECVACHAEPQIHTGLFGLNCAACHTTTAWAPAQLVQHTFPLNHGGQGEIDCATCHTHTYVAYTCYGCHEHDPAKTQSQHASLNLAPEQLNDCTACHPTGLARGGGM